MTDYEYKIKQLETMLNYEKQQPEDKQFGIHLQHWAAGKPINIDAAAIKLLIDYYKHKDYEEKLLSNPKMRLHFERDRYLKTQGTSL